MSDPDPNPEMAFPARQGFGSAGLELLVREIRFASRALRRAPGFSLAVITTLALCIGPYTAILSVLYALVLNPLPFPDARQLVRVEMDRKSGSRVGSAYSQYLDFQAHADLFAGFGIMTMSNSTIGEGSNPERIIGMRATPSLFRLLGVQPLLGRFPNDEEQAVGRDHVLLLSQSYWERKFNSDAAVIGRQIRMGEEMYTIIGVAPRRLEVFDVTVNFWKPYEAEPSDLNPQSRYGAGILIGRLKPGVAPAAGHAQLDALDRRFRETIASPPLAAALKNSGLQLTLHPPREESSAIATSLWLLQCGAMFVLLIGGVNVINLLLARANAKRPELAIRYALGAGRGALLRQMALESLILTFVAAAGGVFLAWIALGIFNYFLPAIIITAMPVTMAPQVLAGTLGLAALIGVAMGTLPFGVIWRSGLRMGSSRTSSAGAGIRLLSGVLIVTQVAIALILLVGAALVLRSFAAVLAVKPGFEPAAVVQARIALPKSYNDAEKNIVTQQRIVAAMKEIPGVQEAATTISWPIAVTFPTSPFVLRTASQSSASTLPLVYGYLASPKFFATMGIPMIAGRDFNATDSFRGSAPVYVVDQNFASRYFPHGEAVGQEIVLGATPAGAGQSWGRIIGVVGHAQLTGLDGMDLPFIYLPLTQIPLDGFCVLVRTSRPTGGVLADMRAKLRDIDPDLPLYATGLLEDGFEGMLSPRRGIMTLLGVFAGLALTLAGIGLYGVLTYDVSQRTREIGVRGALGASRQQIVNLILRQGLWKAAMGLGLGLGGAFYLTRFMRTLLFGVQPVDPTAYLGVSVLLLVVAAVASYVPARRAAKVDPMIALRCE
jgi:putative ABC transport system permease protein